MKIKAIALGVLLDWVGSFILCVPFVVLVTVIHLSQGGKPENIESFLNGNILFLLVSEILGLVPVVAGGALTAYIAKEHRLWNAFLMALASSVLAIPLSISRPLWENIVSYSLMIPCAMLGGWIVEKRNRGHSNPPTLSCATQPGHSDG